jgi:uncharacterized protein (TIGR02145 family)
MQLKDGKNFKIGLNQDDTPADLQTGEYTKGLNIRTLSSANQHETGNLETLQSEIPILISPDISIIYYGQAIGENFIYNGFQTVAIGTQTWMKKNYDAEYPGSKVYDNDDSNEAIYGRLYTHNQIMQSGFCPEGFHVPTEEEWDVLVIYLLGEALAGGKLKNVGTALWESPNTGATDESGFRAVPGGKFDTAFELLGLNGLFWLADDGCPLAPVILNASEITHESFVANWKASDGATGYYLDVSESPTFASFMMGYEDKDVGNVLNSIVEDLESYTTYYFRLRAYNEHCFSGYSLIGTLRTLSMLKDIDGNSYHTKVIGSREWIIDSFRATHYRNGDDIQLVTDPAIWANGNPVDVTKNTYGALYNWWAASKNGGTGSGSIAPTGWHVPSNAEWDTLITYLGGEVVAGGKLKEIGLIHWDDPNMADNSSGFNALGGGHRIVGDGTVGFQALKEWGIFLSTDDAIYDEESGTWYSNNGLVLVHDMLIAGPFFNSTGYCEQMGGSIRCLKNTTALTHGQTGTVTDVDGNVYPTICIGTQEWMASNLKVEHFNDGTDIPIVTDNAAWAALTSEGMCYYPDAAIENILDGFFCWYNNDSATYKEVYGALYNWLAINHASELVYFEREGVEETGWRVPSKQDFLELLLVIDPNFVNNGLQIVGGLLKEMGLTYWNTPNAGAVDYVGFKSRGGGMREYNGTFLGLKDINPMWSTLASSLLEAYYLCTNYGTANVNSLNIPADKRCGFSVRCVRDLTTPPLNKSQIGDSEFRIIVRDEHLCWDQAITGLGFNGVEDQDWINLKMIP